MKIISFSPSLSKARSATSPSEAINLNPFELRANLPCSFFYLVNYDEDEDDDDDDDDDFLDRG